MLKSSFKKDSFGVWRRGTDAFPHVAEVLPDKCLLSQEVCSCLFKARTLVTFYPETITREKNDEGEDVFHISVLPVEESCQQMFPILLFMLDLSDRQKKELMKVRRVPKKAFVKHAVALQADEILPGGFEDELVELEGEIGLERTLKSLRLSEAISQEREIGKN